VKVHPLFDGYDSIMGGGPGGQLATLIQSLPQLLNEHDDVSGNVPSRAPVLDLCFFFMYAYKHVPLYVD
jgi:hypothetical protein